MMTMLKRSLPYLLVIFLILTSTSCIYAEVLEDTAFSDDYDNTTEFFISAKDDFYVTLLSNPSTGYCWNYTISLGDASLIDKMFAEDNSYVPASGVPGKEFYHFRLNIIGLVKLSFNYSRSWEDSAPICTKDYMILVY